MLIAKNVNKTYRQGSKTIYAVNGANIEIKKGERIYIHGPSGAGKSTLLHVLGGLDNPNRGTIFFQDKDIYKFGDKKRSSLRNKHFGFVFQFYHLLPELSVLENVMLPALIKGKEKRKSIASRAEDIIESVKLKERLKHKPSELSGGEVQRTAIARSLINSPQIIFCDEPTGNLDTKTGEEIYQLIYALSSKNDMSVVVVSHQSVDKDFFDTEYFMQDGVLNRMTSGC